MMGPEERDLAGAALSDTINVPAGLDKALGTIFFPLLGQ